MIQKIHDFILIDDLIKTDGTEVIESVKVCINTNFIAKVESMVKDVFIASKITMSDHKTFHVQGTPEDFINGLTPKLKISQYGSNTKHTNQQD